MDLHSAAHSNMRQYSKCSWLHFRWNWYKKPCLVGPSQIQKQTMEFVHKTVGPVQIQIHGLLQSHWNWYMNPGPLVLQRVQRYSLQPTHDRATNCICFQIDTWFIKSPLVGVAKFLGSPDMRIPRSSWTSLMSVLKEVSTTSKYPVTIREMVLQTTDYLDKAIPKSIGPLPF